MTKIKALPPKVVAQIAAGEVVERPASVIKELVENALDAGATQVKITLEQAGLELIKVEDNGQGLSREELPLAVAAHTTSKISSVDDLTHTLTLGFRGEALHSMAAVGELHFASRQSGTTSGSEFSSQEGRTTPVGMPFGTRVTLKNLFATIPARKKFIKSTTQELKANIQVVEQLALSHPVVGFQLLHGSKVLLDFPPDQSLQERFCALTGLTVAHLIPIEYDFTHFHFTGWLSVPEAAQTRRHHQYVIVNQRSVAVPEINKVVRESFGRLLEPRSYPQFVLHLQVPPSLVDSNVHPRKTQIRFIDSPTILHLVEKVVWEALAQFHTRTKYELTHTIGLKLRDGAEQRGEALTAQSRQGLEGLSAELKGSTSLWKPRTEELKNIQQLALTYLVLSTESALIIFDQHAVHERILFEQFVATYKNRATKSSSLSPHPLALSPELQLVAKSNLQTLEEIGFSLRMVNQEWQLAACPDFLEADQAENVLREVLLDLAEERPLNNIYSVVERTLAYLACHGAIQAGEYMAPEQRQQLLEKLLTTPNFSTCPHGRPTIVKITTKDFEKMFKRTGGTSFK